jgi:hypothetical protein
VPSSPWPFGKAENTLVRVDRRYVVACVNGSRRVGNQMVPHVTECLHLGGRVATAQATKAYRRRKEGRKENLCGRVEAARFVGESKSVMVVADLSGGTLPSQPGRYPGRCLSVMKSLEGIFCRSATSSPAPTKVQQSLSGSVSVCKSAHNEIEFTH